jgi:hypothetical protein
VKLYWTELQAGEEEGREAYSSFQLSSSPTLAATRKRSMMAKNMRAMQAPARAPLLEGAQVLNHKASPRDPWK